MSARSVASSARSRAKHTAEERMIRHRDREHRHQQEWDDRAQYYRSWEKKNNKFEEWTSPRYYDSNNHMVEKLQKDREKKENLEKRRAKLKKLVDEENKSFEIEAMVKSRHKYVSPRPNQTEEIPTEILQNINRGIRLEEDERRKRDAELKLYHQWRNNNSSLRDCERAQSAKDLKLSWLDQQIEKRVAKERAEEECRKHLAERERRLELIKHKEEELQKDTASRNLQLKRDIERQMEQLKSKQKESDNLQYEERLAVQKLGGLLAIAEKQKAEERRRSEKECALFNIRQHKMKLRQQAANVQENLKQERSLVEQLQSLEIVERIQNDQKKQEIKAAMGEFLEFTKQQHALEEQRQKHMDLIFDSESQAMYEQQRAVWQEEEKSRQELLHSVLDILKHQMDEKLESNKERQKEVLEERERMVQLMEDYAEEEKHNKQEHINKTAEWKAEVEQQLKEKAELKERARKLEEGDVERQLQSARKEEERIKQEIVNLQRKEGVYKRPPSRILY